MYGGGGAAGCGCCSGGGGGGGGDKGNGASDGDGGRGGAILWANLCLFICFSTRFSLLLNVKSTVTDNTLLCAKSHYS